MAFKYNYIDTCTDIISFMLLITNMKVVEAEKFISRFVNINEKKL